MNCLACFDKQTVISMTGHRLPCPKCTVAGHKTTVELKPELEMAKEDVSAELYNAMKNFAPMHSAHEGFAVLAEEVDELWTHVKTNQSKRDIGAMRKEAIQVAAMALRFAVDVCNPERGRV